MKKIKQVLVLPVRIGRLKNYRITQVSQIHMIAFWITLIGWSVLTTSYLVCVLWCR